MKLEQAEALKDLEKLIGKSIPLKNKVYWNTFGIKIDGDNVISLGLYRCGLTTLPESIGNFTSLRELYLGINKLTVIPESIGKLKLLKTLDLFHNKLTTLPKSLKNLELLEDVDLRANPLSPKNPSRILIPLFFIFILLEFVIVFVFLILKPIGFVLFILISHSFIVISLLICMLKSWQVSKTQKEKQMEVLKELLKNKL